MFRVITIMVKNIWLRSTTKCFPIVIKPLLKNGEADLKNAGIITIAKIALEGL
jgi:hypothetical protein